jgi:hypothetical protein
MIKSIMIDYKKFVLVFNLIKLEITQIYTKLVIYIQKYNHKSLFICIWVNQFELTLNHGSKMSSATAKFL